MSTDVREDHLQYLASWLKALRQDKTVLQRAVVDAAKAVAYLSASSTPDEE
jgi:antirestriction protein ArdC